MRSTILRYGFYSALAELVCFILIWLIIDVTHIGHEIQGNISWANLICPLLFVYFGLKYYRDKINNGQLGFLQGIKIGLLIVIIPSIAFAIIESVYVLVIDPKFYENIAKYDLEEYRKVLSPAAFAAKAKAIQQKVVIDNNPFYNFIAMVFTVDALGSIITVISALLLYKRRGKVSAAAPAIVKA